MHRLSLALPTLESIKKILVNIRKENMLVEMKNMLITKLTKHVGNWYIHSQVNKEYFFYECSDYIYTFRENIRQFYGKQQERKDGGVAIHV